MKPSEMNIEELWQAYQLHDERELTIQNLLIEHYMYLVRSIVYRLLPTYEGYSEYDDLLSTGVLGLVDAITKFDPSRNVKFESYASIRIRGEIIDHIRKQDWAPSSMRRKIKQITDGYTQLQNKLERAPSEYELAEFLDMEPEELQSIMKKSHMFNVVHFESMLSENFSVGNIIPDEEDLPDEVVEKEEIVNILGDMIDYLPERERLIVSLYYYEEMTLKEIAEVVGVSESRISQIHSQILLKLHEKMQPYVEK